jgi:hypothetical protein
MASRPLRWHGYRQPPQQTPGDWHGDAQVRIRQAAPRIEPLEPLLVTVQ